MKAAKRHAVSVLKTKAELERVAKLAEYIRHAREDLADRDIQWSAPSWQGFGVFTNLRSTRTGAQARVFAAAALLDAEFIDFAKAYLIQCRSSNPAESRTQSAFRLTALRLVEAALKGTHGAPSPLRIDRNVLDQAANLARTTFTGRTVAASAAALQQLGRVLAGEGILPLDIKSWQHPFSTAKTSWAVGTDGDLARAAKLPDPAAIDALAEVFNGELDASDPRDRRDIFTTSVTALLFSGPSRVSQIVRLPRNALHRSSESNGKQRTSLRVDATIGDEAIPHRNGKPQVALRVGASKGFEPHVKWIVEDMVPAVEKAIARVAGMTDEARQLARHYENAATRGTFYRHASCPDVDEDAPLTVPQVCQALGFQPTNATATLKSAGLSKKSFGTYTLRKLWSNWVLPELGRRCPHFPYVSAKDKARGEKGGLKFSEALFCMRANELDSRKGTSPVLLWMPGRSTYIQDVGFISTETQNRGLTLFERHNYTDDQGKVLGFTSHQARHLLNTEAQRSSLPDDLIARWSGRKRINQNAVYDQRSTQERVEHSRSVVVATAAETDKRSIELESKARRDGPWLIISPRQPRSCSDLDDIEPHLTGLQTQYGECYHDYAVTPCDGFVECLECKDHDCIKGSDQDAQTRLARLELLKRRADAEVEKSRTAVAAGDWGAQDWLKVQRARVSKLEELIAILLDPSVPDGARVRLADTDLPTHLHRMLRGMARQALANRLVPEHVIQQMLVAIDPEATLASTVKVHPRPALAGRVAGEEEAHGT